MSEDTGRDTTAPMWDEKPVLSFIGAGKVGKTLARLLSRAGYPVGYVYSRTAEHAQLLAADVGATWVDHPTSAFERGEITFVTVPDSEIEAVDEQIAHGLPDYEHKALVHTSGAKSAKVMRETDGWYGLVGSLHPAYPLAHPDGEDTLAGVTFGIEAEDQELREHLIGMVAAIDGVPLLVPPGAKAQYHAAFVLLNNVVTLYAASERLLMDIGAPREAADQALNRMLQGLTANVLAKYEGGIAHALAGPLTRADVETVQAHLDELSAYPDIQAAYLSLARLIRPLLARRGMSAADLARIDAVLNT